MEINNLRKGEKIFMQYLKSDNHYIVGLDKNDEIINSISKICEAENIKTGIVNGIGAANDIDIGIFDTENKNILAKITLEIMK